VTALAEAVLAGDTRAAARACRVVDEAWAGHAELLSQLYAAASAAWLIGVTGSPGVGKSTLTSRLVEELRKEQLRVGVVAVDPSSPFSGGALLGDRIRMQAHWDDAEVFIRSVGTRGAMGGLSRTTADIARVLAAWGASVVLIETVGVGQDELDVMRVAHGTLVVQAPGAGDDIQAAKAGLIECADVFVVNKADLSGAESLAQQLRAMLALGHVTAGSAQRGGGHALGARLPTPSAPADAADPEWEVSVVSCVASRGEGIAELLAELRRHHAWLTGTERGRARWRQRLREELVQRLQARLGAVLFEHHRAEIDSAADEVSRGEVDPYVASAALVERWTRTAAP
jgi:LAO/AO transport system kinase